MNCEYLLFLVDNIRLSHSTGKVLIWGSDQSPLVALAIVPEPSGLAKLRQDQHQLAL
jgi:hypothetical protein